jgi:hypothetical protein
VSLLSVEVAFPQAFDGLAIRSRVPHGTCF